MSARVAELGDSDPETTLWIGRKISLAQDGSGWTAVAAKDVLGIFNSHAQAEACKARASCARKR
jgi:hypothetical protein